MPTRPSAKTPTSRSPLRPASACSSASSSAAAASRPRRHGNRAPRAAGNPGLAPDPRGRPPGQRPGPDRPGFSLELQEEKFRLIQIFFWISAVFFAGVDGDHLRQPDAGLSLLGKRPARSCLAASPWPIPRACISLIVAFRRYLARQPRLLAATLQELAEDRACIRRGTDGSSPRRKAALVDRISMQPGPRSAAAARVTRPLEWFDRAIARWRQLSPLVKFAAIPLGFLVEALARRAARGCCGAILRWGPRRVRRRPRLGRRAHRGSSRRSRPRP